MEQIWPVLCSLALVTNGVRHSLTGSEEPATTAWLEVNWTNENDTAEVIIRENGCICRVRLQNHAVCYGGACFAFPKNISLPEDLVDVRFKTTEILVIAKDDLVNFDRLENLWIDANNNLNSISPGSFEEMVNLRNLSVSYNTDLKVLHPDTFIGLVKLESLRLVKNGFTNILDASQALQARYLPSLSYLSLCENSFPVIDDKAFVSMAGTGLQELELVLCQITKIKPKAFVVFQNLTKLRIGDNLLSEEKLADVFNQLKIHQISVKLLNLYNFGLRGNENLTKLLIVIAKLNITHLVLARNHIETITAGLFPSMPYLETLDLREVSAVTVEEGAFDPVLMPELKVLLLAGNKLSTIVPGILLRQLSFLDISENSYSPASYFDVSTNNILNNSLNLTAIDLSFNRISTIRKNTFQNFLNLQVLGLKNVTLFYLSRKALANLTQLRILNLENNALQPFNRFQAPVFNGLINLEILYLGNCKISSFNYSMIFSNLTKLKYLDLRDNDLIHIEAHLLAPLISLQGINIADNRLQSWTSRMFENHTNIRLVVLYGNRLHTISVAMIEDLVGTQVDFSNNPFTCDCWSFNHTKRWLSDEGAYAADTSIITSPNNVCNAPDSWKEQPVSAFLSSDDNCLLISGKSGITTPVYIVMLVLIAVGVVFGGLAYYYRWYIRYWIFLARMSFYRRHGWLLKRNKVHPGDYKYDVFVSYSHEDRNFIVRLVAMLENEHPFLKLCVYERDFEVGTVISTTVMEKVSLSRRTLLVVSNAFAKSQWCMWELQLAECHRIFFRGNFDNAFCNDPLVIIKLGNIAPTSMTPTLKFLLKSRIYLEWSPDDAKKQIAFWQKLRLTLTPQNEESQLERLPQTPIASLNISENDQYYSAQ